MSTIMLAGGQVLVNCHPATECNGRACPLHTLTDHAMRHFPQRIRETGLMERICTHGVGHPDPDGLPFFEERGIKGMDVHGCDGCCSGNGPIS